MVSLSDCVRFLNHLIDLYCSGCKNFCQIECHRLFKMICLFENQYHISSSPTVVRAVWLPQCHEFTDRRYQLIVREIILQKYDSVIKWTLSFFEKIKGKLIFYWAPMIRVIPDLYIWNQISDIWNQISDLWNQISDLWTLRPFQQHNEGKIWLSESDNL